MKITEILSEVNPHNYDSDVDYYAARDAKPRQRSAPSDYPYSQQQDDDYFREIFRKQRLAKKKAEQEEDHKRLATGTNESASAATTSSANIGTVDNPQLSPGKARGKQSYIGSPGKSGTKAPPQPKVVQPKKSDGTAVNGLDMKGANLFGGGTVKRS
jgi:hypothetical protein